MLRDVLALAGCGVDGAGREIAFTYIVNGPGAGLLLIAALGEPLGSRIIRVRSCVLHIS